MFKASLFAALLVVAFSEQKLSPINPASKGLGLAEENGYRLVEFGTSAVAGSCSKKSRELVENSLEFGFRYSGDNPTETNLCAQAGGYSVHVATPERTESCSREVICTNGRLLDEQSECTKEASECFDRSENCMVPKARVMPKGDCTEKNWDAFKPKMCSISSREPGCEQSGHLQSVAYVIDSKHQARYVSTLKIEEAVITSRDDSYITDRHWKPTGRVTGNRLYCRHNDDIPSCYNNVSSDGVYRIFKSNSQIPFVHLGQCSEPVYCYGYMDIMVFDYMKDNIVKPCPSCSATCSEKGYHLILPIHGQKHIQVCGRVYCDTFDQISDVLDSKRSFHSRISDQRLKVSVYSEDRLTKFETYVDCPEVELCAAIDCYICYDHWLNPSCYAFYDWAIALLVLYIGMLISGFIIVLMSPVVKSAFGLLKFCLRLVYKTMKVCCGGVKKGSTRVQHYVNSDEVHLEVEPMLRSTRSQGRRAPIGTGKLVTGIVILAIISSVYCKAPCSQVTVTNIPIESCKVTGSEYECKTTSLVEVPMVSYDQATCLAFIAPNGHIIGELQITPYDVQFKCQKQDLFWTRDFELKSDHITRCPHAGSCTDSWCSSVDDSTIVEGMPTLLGPSHQFCKLGGACAGHGCFYCTNMCHVIRYHAEPRSSTLYKVFNCPRWDPSATIHTLWESDGETAETTINLIHGQTVEVTKGTTISLELTVQTQLPILSKSFITDGVRMAITDSSFAGQPVPGQVGQIQCTSESLASESRCLMAPNICLCNPSGDGDVCDCSQVYISKIFDSESTLPISIGNYHIEEQRDVPYLKAAAFGSGKILVRSSKTMRGPAMPPQECKIKDVKVDGCYACIRGSSLNYTCIADKPMTTILQCNNNISIPISCGSSGIVSRAHFQYDTPIVDLSCHVPCSKTPLKVKGTLSHVSKPLISGGSHIHLAPTAVQQGIWASIVKFFASLGWYSILWLTGLVALMAVVIMIVKCSFSTFSYRMLKGRKAL